MSYAFRLEAISDPGFGEDIGRRSRVGLDLLTQLADEDPEVFGLFGTVSAPDMGEEFTVRHYFMRIARKVREEIEFLRS